MALRILNGHYSFDTACEIPSYPFGFKLRCKMRCWVEASPRKGYRFWTCTSDPRRESAVWNKPKASVYSAFGVMYLNDEDHVRWWAINHHLPPEYYAKFKVSGLADQLDREQSELFVRIVAASRLSNPKAWIAFDAQVSHCQKYLDESGGDDIKATDAMMENGIASPLTTLPESMAYAAMLNEKAQKAA